MRKSVASFALFVRDHGETRQWLARWNRHWDAYHFVGGRKEDSESFRECCIREIKEELGIVEGNDYRVAQAPLQRIEFTAWSIRADAETAYVFEVFEARFTRDTLADQVAADPQVRWLSRDEIAAETTSDGRAVSTNMERVISLLEESS